MDLDGIRIMSHLSARSADSARLPVIGLTRRGDLRNKLAAVETGIAANQHVAASCHIFRPLNCTPSIICRFATPKTMRRGTALMTAPAMIGPNESA